MTTNENGNGTGNETGNEAGALFRQGRLADAIQAAGLSVRQSPADAGRRVLLAELLLFAGEFERADAVIVAAEAVEPDAALVIAEFRQLLRAATARRQLASDGRLPEFLGEPTAVQKRILEALVALRADDPRAAAEAVEAAEATRRPVSGTADGSAFDDFRDADDLCNGSIEVLTTTGKYFWVAAERVLSMEFHPPKRPRDLFWRRCTMSVREGPDGDVYLPVLYGTDAGADDSLRLGRSTEWSDASPVRGRGQRVFLVGEAGVPVSQLRLLEFT